MEFSATRPALSRPRRRELDSSAERWEECPEMSQNVPLMSH